VAAVKLKGAEEEEDEEQEEKKRDVLLAMKFRVWEGGEKKRGEKRGGEGEKGIKIIKFYNINNFVSIL
jgi:hypothetical protein